MTSRLMIAIAVIVFAQGTVERFPAFTDVASSLGLTLVNISGEGQNDYIVEANGNGAAFFDYDNDGDMDVLITNGSTLRRLRERRRSRGRPVRKRDGRVHGRTARSRHRQERLGIRRLRRRLRQRW